MIDRKPPQDLNAEAAVLGGMLINNRAALDVLDQLATSDFYSQQHRAIFDAITSLASAGRPHDAVTVCDALRKAGTLDDAGGTAYLGELYAECPGAANIRTYTRIVREKAMLREVIATAAESSADAFGDGNPSEIVDAAEARLFELRQRGARGAMRARGFDEIIPASEDMVDAARRGTQRGAPTGLADLDRIIHGLHQGLLIVLAGRPSMGKSALGMNIAESVAKTTGPVLVFSMEMTAEQIGLRSIAGHAQVPLQRLLSGELEAEEWSAMANRGGSLRTLPIAIDETPGLSPMELRARARRAHAKQPLSLIVVDYLQLMHMKAENRTNEISEISRSLKTLAKELRVPVLALSQLSRSVEARENKRPRLSDLRESGSIEQDADIVLMVYRDEYYSPDTPDQGIAEVIVAKHRNGACGTVETTFRGEYCRFENYAGPSRAQRHPPAQKPRRGLAAVLDA